MSTVPDSQPQGETREFVAETSRNHVVDSSIAYDKQLPEGLDSERRSISTPGQSSLHSSHDTLTGGRVWHHPDHMVALQRLNDYDSPNNCSHSDEEPSKGDQEDSTPRCPSRLLSTSSDILRQTSPPLGISSPTSFDQRDAVVFLHASERKRPLEPDAGSAGTL